MTRQPETAEIRRRADADARVLAAVCAAPGLTVYALRSSVRLHDEQTRRALNRLEEAGKVRRDQRPGNTPSGYVSYWYPATGAEEADQRRKVALRSQNTGALLGSVGQLVPSTEAQQDTVRQLAARYATGPEDQALILEALGL